MTARQPAMRVVTYARVSTKTQRDRGVSLDDQETRFGVLLERTGAVRVQAYAEAKSAGTVMQRKTFLRMFEEPPSLSVDALVIDSLDRFSRATSFSVLSNSASSVTWASSCGSLSMKMIGR